MQSTIMMALSTYRFCLTTAAYDELSRSHEWRWPEVERIGARPARQFVGPGPETLNLKGTIYPSFAGGLGQVDFMRAEADKGVPLTLVDGQGKVWGDYCVLSIKETQTTLFSDGTPRKIDFEISLGESGG